MPVEEEEEEREEERRKKKKEGKRKKKKEIEKSTFSCLVFSMLLKISGTFGV